MGGFLRTLWWFVLFFCLFSATIWVMRCLEIRCYCEDELKLTNCSGAKLKVILKSGQLVNYTTLNLRYNLLIPAIFVLEEQFPNLTKVDNQLCCKGFANKRFLKGIMITDCEITTSVKTPRKATTRILKTRKLGHPMTTSILPSSHPGVLPR